MLTVHKQEEKTDGGAPSTASPPKQETNPMQPLPQRQVTLTITLIAKSDDEARATIDEALMTDGSVLDYEIVDIRDSRTQEPDHPLAR